MLPDQGRLLTLLDDSSLHLWEITHQHGCARLEEVLSFQPPNRAGFDGARYQHPWPRQLLAWGRGEGSRPRRGLPASRDWGSS